MYGYEIFHEKLMSELIDQVHRGEIQQAYIFEGKSGLARHTSAELFAAAITCEKPSAAPCGVCRSCIEARAKTNPDIKYVNSGDKKTIGVDVIRGINADAIVKSYQSARKVYIIEGDLLTPQSQNAFLKTLEEPPEFVTFIIIVQNANMLLQTVLSRCVLIRFSPLPDRFVRGYIKEHYPEEERVEFLVRYAQGIPEAADKIIADETFEPLRAEAFEVMTSLLSPHSISAYTVVDFLEKNKERTALILDFWVSFMRDILLIKTDSEEMTVNQDYKEKLERRACRLDDKFVVGAMENLMTAQKMQQRSINLRAWAFRLAFGTKKNW